MQLIAMATGQTRTIEMRSSPIQTAYLKTPVSGPCYVHEHGLAGNETAVHPDAIYAIANEHYEFWANRLGADRSTWLPGQFAENLTIAGLDESSLRVGDVIAIGPDVMLIVTGPHSLFQARLALRSAGQFRARVRSFRAQRCLLRRPAARLDRSRHAGGDCEAGACESDGR